MEQFAIVLAKMVQRFFAKCVVLDRFLIVLSLIHQIREV
jgi:hypothetical protein